MKVKKTAIVYHKSDLDGVVSAAIATMYENSKNKDVIYIPYSYEDDVKKVIDKVDECGVVYVLDVSFGADSKTIFKKWLDEGKSLMWIDHHKGIIEDSKTWGGVRSSRVEKSRYRCVRTGLGPADGEGAGDSQVLIRLRCAE